METTPDAAQARLLALARAGDAQAFGQLVAALKPGAHLLVVDHSAKDGAGTDAAKGLHRFLVKR